MGTTTAIIMLAYMLGTYAKKCVNAAIFLGRGRRYWWRALAGAQPGYSGRGILDEGHDPALLDRYPNE